MDKNTRLVDLTGKRFGKLVVLMRYGYSNGKKNVLHGYVNVIVASRKLCLEKI